MKWNTPHTGPFHACSPCSLAKGHADTRTRDRSRQEVDRSVDDGDSGGAMGTGWYLGIIWVFGVGFRLFLALVLPALWLLTFNSPKTRHCLCNCVDFGNVNLLHSRLNL